jgi:repressor LexA
MGITKKQLEILQFIEDYQRKNNGISPSLEEIKNHFKLNAVSTVFGHLERLKKEGLIEKEWNSKRGIKIKRKIPLIGVVAAGLPVEAFENIEYIEIPDYLLSGGQNFALKVSGNSMVDEGIFDGDLIILNKNKNPENGDLVIAMVDGEMTLKKYYRIGDKIKLQPANPNFKPIYVNEKDIKIQGIVIALIRKFNKY